MKNKLPLKDLKIKSFIISIDAKEKKTLESMEDIYIPSRILCIGKKIIAAVDDILKRKGATNGCIYTINQPNTCRG